MNLQDLIKKSSVTKLSIEVDGNKGDIYVRPLMAGGKTELLIDVTGLLQLKKKIDDAKEKGEEYEPTGEEIAKSAEYKMKQAFQLLCEHDGTASYPSYKEMVRNVPNNIMDAICEAIDAHLVPESAEEIEKN
jgi:hypothetical protein